VKRRTDELIDFLLGELPEERAADLRDHPDRARYEEAIELIRVAAAEGWAPRRRRRLVWLRPVVAAAAVLLVALSVFLLNGTPGAERVFEPDGTYGYLLPEEIAADGSVHTPARGDRTVLRNGTADVAALGSERSYPLEPGDVIAVDSEISAPTESALRIDLPHGGILFVAPLSTVQLRRRNDGQTALRLINGTVCTVAGSKSIHVAVHGTDLLLENIEGAAMLRSAPPEAVCLRGRLVLSVDDGRRFDVPPGHRLPAACSNDPQTIAASSLELDLDWYRSLVFRPGFRAEDVEWERPGVSRPMVADATLLYLRLARPNGEPATVRFGGETRTFRARAVELRIPLSNLGPGPVLEVTPANAIAEARLLRATPR